MHCSGNIDPPPLRVSGPHPSSSRFIPCRIGTISAAVTDGVVFVSVLLYLRIIIAPPLTPFRIPHPPSIPHLVSFPSESAPLPPRSLAPRSHIVVLSVHHRPPPPLHPGTAPPAESAPFTPLYSLHGIVKPSINHPPRRCTALPAESAPLVPLSAPLGAVISSMPPPCHRPPAPPLVWHSMSKRGCCTR